MWVYIMNLTAYSDDAHHRFHWQLHFGYVNPAQKTTCHKVYAYLVKVTCWYWFSLCTLIFIPLIEWTICHWVDYVSQWQQQHHFLGGGGGGKRNFMGEKGKNCVQSSQNINQNQKLMLGRTEKCVLLSVCRQILEQLQKCEDEHDLLACM